MIFIVFGLPGGDHFGTVFDKYGGTVIARFHAGRDMGMLAVMTTPLCDMEPPEGAAELQNRTLWARVYVFFLILAPSCIHLAPSSSQRRFKL